MILLLILALLLQGKPAAPFSDPNDPDDPGKKLVYDKTVTVPATGQVVIPFDPAFLRPPSCQFEGGTLPGEAPKITTSSAQIKAKPGVKMHYICKGILKESDEKRT